MRSIRTSLLTGTLVGAILVLVGAGIAVERGVRSTLIDQLDHSLEDEARLLASTVEESDEGTEVEFEDLDMRDFEGREGPGYLQLTLDDGEVLYRSPSAEGLDLPGTVADETPAFHSARFGGYGVRVMTLGFNPRIDPDLLSDEDDGEDESSVPAETIGAEDTRVVVLVIARRTETIDAFLARLRLLLGVVGLVAGVLVLVIQRAVIRRSLRPLDLLAREIAELGDQLSRRITLEPIPREVEPVVRRLNELLDRVEAAFERERTFSADVAHELRTPLAGLRTSMEVELSRPREADDYRDALARSLEIVRQLQAMVQRLLCLARLEAGQVHIDEQTEDLCEVVRATWVSLTPLAAQRKLDTRCTLPARAPVTTDRSLSEVVVRNVIENALRHADEGGRVEVEVEVVEDRRQTLLRVTNSGSRVAHEQVPDLFERFSRGDVSRDQTGLHCGLGLALVAKITSLLGMEVSVETSIGGEFSISLRMPSASRVGAQNSPARRVS